MPKIKLCFSLPVSIRDTNRMIEGFRNIVEVEYKDGGLEEVIEYCKKVYGDLEDVLEES